MTSWTNDVLGFWFDELEPKQWWVSDPQVDENIRTRFGALHGRLAHDPPSLDPLDARDHLATVIVFDQFSRNLFRDSAAAFATDALALAVALSAIDRQLDRRLAGAQRQFLYMPLEHCEDLRVQRRSLEVFASVPDKRAFKAAREHHDTIVRFGRFPSRNAALGRTSTVDELAFMTKHRRPK